MAKPQYNYKHQQERKVALARLVPGTPCAFCKKPMFPWQKLDFDHVVPVAFGGANGLKRLTHASCNRSKGSSIANARKKRRRNRWLRKI